jgi:hypothetical protein
MAATAAVPTNARPRNVLSKAAAGAGAKVSAGANVVALYPHLHFDPISSHKAPLPEVLDRLEALGAHMGKTLTITSGFRDDRDQVKACQGNSGPCAAPGHSNHRYGLAADVWVGGSPLQSVASSSTLRQFGLWPLAGDAPHVELSDPHGGELRASLSSSTLNALYAAGTAHAGFARIQSDGKSSGGGLAVVRGNVSLPTSALNSLKKLGADVLGSGLTTPIGPVIAGEKALSQIGIDLPDAASTTAKAIVDLLFGALGEQGAYAAVTVMLVAGGGALIVAGAMRASGYPRKVAAPA